MHCFGFPKDGADLQEKRTLWEGVKREEKFFHWGCTDNGAMRHAGSWTMGLYASSSPFLSLISLPPHPLFCIYSILLFYEFIVILCNFFEFILIFGEFFGFCWCDTAGNKLWLLTREWTMNELWTEIQYSKQWVQLIRKPAQIGTPKLSWQQQIQSTP